MTSELLNVQGLETQFKTPEGVVHAVNGVDFTLKEGETLGVVGESGCGKSVSMLSILRLIQQPPGHVPRAGFAQDDQRRNPPCQRRSDFDGLPGPYDFPEPGYDHR